MKILIGIEFANVITVKFKTNSNSEHIKGNTVDEVADRIEILVDVARVTIEFSKLFG